MYLKTYQLGSEVVLPLLCKDGTGVPTDPDAAPRVTVYGPTGAAVADFYLPVVDKAETVGWFQGNLYLGAEFSPGHYHAVFRYLVGGSHQGDTARFEVIPGGAESGQVIAMHSYERPHSDFMVQQRTSGRIYKGRNPRV